MQCFLRLVFFLFVCLGVFWDSCCNCTPLVSGGKTCYFLSSQCTLEIPTPLQIQEKNCTEQFSTAILFSSGSWGVACHTVQLLPSSLEVNVPLFVLPWQFQILLQPSVRGNDSSRTNVILLTLAKYSICKPFHLIQAFTFFKRDYSWLITPHKTWMSLVYCCFPVEWVTNAEHLTVMPESL